MTHDGSLPPLLPKNSMYDMMISRRRRRRRRIRRIREQESMRAREQESKRAREHESMGPHSAHLTRSVDPKTLDFYIRIKLLIEEW